MPMTCGSCKDTHQTVDEVRNCYYTEHMHEQDAKAEMEAEARNERFWENRGSDDGFEEWERSRGVLSFSDAWDASDRAQGLTVSTRTGLPLGGTS